MSNQSKVMQCKCKHKHQDEFHGTNNRVFNRCKPNQTNEVYRCTVCGSEKGGRDESK